MKMLRELIDKRTKERLERQRKEDEDCKLSKKTSFSSFYNLNEEEKENLTPVKDLKK